MAYRRLRKGDTIRVTGDRGHHLFNSEFGNVELNNGIELGVECVLVRGEDINGTVVIPRGILANDQVYLDARCIELVQAVEDKPTAVEAKTVTVKYIYDGPDDHLCVIDDFASKKAIARIWYDPYQVPMEVVKAFVEDIKTIVTKRKINNSKKK